MKHRMLVMTLVVLFVLGLAGPALAGDPGEFFTDVSDWETEFFAEAAYWLGRMGIFIGDAHGNLLPDQPLTRAQMAVVQTRMTGQENLAAALSGSSTAWSDDTAIPSWARGYMALAEARGWFVGYPDGTVRPSEPLLFEQIAILLARITGNDDLAVGPWPASAMIAGEEMGIFDDIEDATAGLPITRGQMVSATFRAMLVDTFMNRPEADGGPELPLMATHYADDHDDWLEEPAVTVTGEWTAYLTASQRITVAGTNYNLQLDGDDPDVSVVINDETVYYTVFSLVFSSLENEEITLTFNDEDEVAGIEAVLDTYADEFITAIDVSAGEEEFGTVTVGCDVLDVDDETVVLLDGVPVTLAALEQAFDDFAGDWNADRVIATVRTFGNQAGSGERAIWVSVITDNLVEGEITGKGTDGTGGFVRIDGAKYYYEAPLTSGDFSTGDHCILLLDSRNRPRLILEASVTVEESEFFGMLVTFEVDVDHRGTATFEWSDGTQKEYAYDATAWTLTSDDVGWVRYVIHDGSNFTTLAVPTSATQVVASQELVNVTDTYIQTDDGFDTTTLVLADSVFAFDDTISLPDHVALEDLLGKHVSAYADSHGDVGFVMTVPSPVSMAVAALEAFSWDDIAVGRNAVSIAQLVADGAADGVSVSLVSTNVPTVIAADGEAVAHGGSDLVFRVTRGTAEADTESILVMIVPWGVHAGNSSATSTDLGDGTALVELVVQNQYNSGLIGFGTDDIALSSDGGGTWHTLSEIDSLADWTITLEDQLNGAYRVLKDHTSDTSFTVDVRVDGVVIETGLAFTITGN